MRKQLTLLFVALLAVMCLLSACSGKNTPKSAYMIAVENGFEGTESEWLEELKGKDGVDGKDGVNGIDGKDGIPAPLTVYDYYLASGFEGTLDEFISEQLRVSYVEPMNTLGDNLLSTVSVVIDEEMTGSGFIYKIDKVMGNAYVVTDYHVIYSGGKTSNNIKVYLYGYEDSENAIPAYFVGGSKLYDIAVLRITNNETIIRSSACETRMANSDEITIGEKVFAIGNADGKGISVTDGIVSKESDNVVTTSADGKTTVSARVMSITNNIRSGNSGGGLYNAHGELVGMLNAKITNTESSGLGYAFPSNVVKNIVENVLYNYGRHNKGEVKKYLLGAILYENNSRAVKDERTGKVYTETEVTVYETDNETEDSVTIEENAMAYGKLFRGDIIEKVEIRRNGREEAEGFDEEYKIRRSFTIVDLLLTMREGDEMRIWLERKQPGGMTEEVKVDFVMEEKYAMVCE